MSLERTPLLRRLLLGSRWAVIGLLGVTVARAEPSHPLRVVAAATQVRAGEEAYMLGRPADAISPLRQAVSLQLDAGDLPGAVRGWVNLALAQRAARDAAGAENSAARLRELVPAAQQQARVSPSAASDDAEDLGAAAAWLEALLLLDRGQATEAGRVLGAVTAKLRTGSPWLGRLETIRAEVALALDRPAEALARARAGQVACVAAQDRAEEARALRMIGAVHVKLGQWREAQAAVGTVVKIEESLGAGRRMVGDLNRLAMIAEKVGDSAAARLYAQRAQAIAAER